MQGRKLVVTGGLGTLGRGVAEIAAQRGAKVVVIDFATGHPPGAGITLIGGADLSRPDAAETAIKQARDALGGIDALINIAGGFAWETVAGGSLDTWDKLYTINVKTGLNATKAALPHLLQSKSGRIVNIGANGAVKAATGMGAYAASKSAVHKLTEALAEELKDKGVTVNAVLPSIIDTPVNRKDMPDADFSKWVSVADLAAVILFLASEEAKAVTGALVPVIGRV
jgi:NAD(P)-dependent dehydrogenase (short-subunit alcohol dehydrogenase family)